MEIIAYSARSERLLRVIVDVEISVLIQWGFPFSKVQKYISTVLLGVIISWTYPSVSIVVPGSLYLLCASNDGIHRACLCLYCNDCYAKTRFKK